MEGVVRRRCSAGPVLPCDLYCVLQRTFEFAKIDNEKVKEDVSADVKENYVLYHMTDDDTEVAVIEDFNRVSKSSSPSSSSSSSSSSSFICSEQHKKTSVYTIQCRTGHKGVKHLQVPQTQ